MEQSYALLRKVNRLAATIASVLVVVMIVHIAISAFLRYGLRYPLSGSMIIVSYYYMVAIVFLPLADAEDCDAHITVDVLYGFFGRWLRVVVDTLTGLMGIALTGVLTWRSWLEFASKHVEQAAVFENSIRFILWPTYAALPLGFGLLCLTMTAKLVLRLAGRTPQPA